MKRFILIGASLLTMVTPLHAQRADSAAFIVRLGTDTTSVERYIRTDDRLTVEAVQRSPSTIIHRLVLFINRSNEVERGMYATLRPGSSTNLAERTITVPTGLVPIVGPFYSLYEVGMMRAMANRAAAKMDVSFLRGVDTVVIPFERVGRDSVALTNQFGEPMRAHVDAAGRLLHLHTPAFTTVERVRWANVDELAAEFAVRDATGRGMGMLSPRSTSRVRVAGANVWVDYSRPAKRGRPIWGKLVPFGAVWRTGANDATHFSIDRAIAIGGQTLAPGTYTLFLEPNPDEWHLIINKQTGMSGLQRDPGQDVARIKLTMETLENPIESFTITASELDKQGRLALSWDRTRGYVPFTVK